MNILRNICICISIIDIYYQLHLYSSYSIKIYSLSIGEVQMEMFLGGVSHLWRSQTLQQFGCFHVSHLVKKHTWNNLHSHYCFVLNIWKPKETQTVMYISRKWTPLSYTPSEEILLPCAQFLNEVVNERYCYSSSVEFFSIVTGYIVPMSLSSS